MEKMKYVVVIEAPDGGYMAVHGICESFYEAVGRAYMGLTEDEPASKYRVSLLDELEGGEGCVMSLLDIETGKEAFTAAIVKYKEDET